MFLYYLKKLIVSPATCIAAAVLFLTMIIGIELDHPAYPAYLFDAAFEIGKGGATFFLPVAAVLPIACLRHTLDKGAAWQLPLLRGTPLRLRSPGTSAQRRCLSPLCRPGSARTRILRRHALQQQQLFLLAAARPRRLSGADRRLRRLRRDVRHLRLRRLRFDGQSVYLRGLRLRLFHHGKHAPYDHRSGDPRAIPVYHYDAQSRYLLCILDRLHDERRRLVPSGGLRPRHRPALRRPLLAAAEKETQKRIERSRPAAVADLSGHIHCLCL